MEFQWRNVKYPELRILISSVNITGVKEDRIYEKVATDATFDLYMYQPASSYWEKKDKNHVPRIEFTSPKIPCTMVNEEILIDGKYSPNKKDYETILRLLGHYILKKGFQWGVD